jgi:hypothetical protein
MAYPSRKYSGRYAHYNLPQKRAEADFGIGALVFATMIALIALAVLVAIL